MSKENKIINIHERPLSDCEKCIIFIEMASQLLTLTIWDEEKFVRETMRVILSSSNLTDDEKSGIFIHLREQIKCAKATSRHEIEEGRQAA